MKKAPAVDSIIVFNGNTMELLFLKRKLFLLCVAADLGTCSNPNSSKIKSQNHPLKLPSENQDRFYLRLAYIKIKISGVP
uniref:Uncharacterized protein n=1 Tax=Salix viminalis TaxID=40686 RepID=A0A6N2MQ56_SALVM